MTSSEEFPGDFQAGDIIGEAYTVVAYLGRGAMGHVYHVRHDMLNTEYALKTLSSDKVDELAWRRFQNEAQAIAKMQHPNLVSIYNLGLHRGTLPFYVMDLLRGVDLADKIRADGPLEVKDAARIFIEVCAGISYAHKKGIIHRDIKPGNIFLLEKPGAQGETVKVVDFGIAKLAETKDLESQSLTGIGNVVGTPFYMSPEQCMAERVDARSDIYSLGCTLVEALTGSLPFRARNPTETMLLHQSAPPPTLSKASGGKEFPETIEYIVATTLAKEQSERYQTMDQLAKDLATLIEGVKPPVTQRSFTTVEKVLPASVIQTLEPLSPQVAPQRRLLPLVSVLVACLLAVSGYGYWQYTIKVKQPKKLPVAEIRHSSEPNILDAVSREKEGAQLQLFDDKDPTDTESELPQNQIVTASLQTATPFSAIGKDEGKSFRIFEFPTDAIIGHLSTGDPPRYLKAMGKLSYPQYENITFTPTEIVARSPNCLKRFRSGDVYGVRFNEAADSDAIFKATANIPGVQKLDFSKSRKLTEKSLATLRLFKNLKVFVGSESGSDGEALACVNNFMDIDQLYLPHATKLVAILNKIKSSKKLTRLGLGPCNMSTADFQAVADQSRLTYLDLYGNHVTSHDLAVLSSLRNLTELKLQDAGLDASALQTIKNFKSLTFLGLSRNRLSQNGLASLLELRHLTGLALEGTGIGAANIEILKQFKSLKELRINSPLLKPGDIEKIKGALPGVNVK